MLNFKSAASIIKGQMCSWMWRIIGSRHEIVYISRKVQHVPTIATLKEYNIGPRWAVPSIRSPWNQWPSLMLQGLKDTWEKVAKACTVKETRGTLIGVPVLWQLRQILESFDIGSLIQGGPIWKLQSKKKKTQKHVYMRKCCLQNLKMSKICWACFNNMGPKKTKTVSRHCQDWSSLPLTKEFSGT